MFKAFDPDVKDCPLCNIPLKTHKYTMPYVDRLTKQNKREKRWKRYCDNVLVNHHHHYDYSCDGHITVEYKTHYIVNWVPNSMNQGHPASGAIFLPWDSVTAQLEEVYRSNNDFIPLCDDMQELLNYLRNKDILS